MDMIKDMNFTKAEQLDKFELFKDEKQLSPYGNSLVAITEEQIEQLRQGNVLIHDDGEYCTLIKLGGQSND